MAEGFARHYGGEHVEVFSAGLKPSMVHSRAIAVMKEKGIDISGQCSKGLEEVPINEMDLVITLCGDAEERCPTFQERITRFHWPIQDPVQATGTEEEIIKKFREVRDEIDERVQGLLGKILRQNQARGKGQPFFP